MDEKALLGVVLEELRRQNAMLLKTLEQLTEQNRQKDERIEELSQMLLNLQRARFGQRSEKSVYVLDDSSVKQLSLFDALTSFTIGNNAPGKESAMRYGRVCFCRY